jgi:hypothetical protein
VLLSAATTPVTIAYELNNGFRADARTRTSAESIAQALTILGAAGYGRTSPEDAAALDAALEDSTRAVRRLRTGTRWPSRATSAMKALIGL